MELFENILTGEKSSKYKTNHFHMFVDDDVSIPDVENMSDDAFGTLIHEYVHYIQHITTLFGIRTCSMFHKISILYRASNPIGCGFEDHLYSLTWSTTIPIERYGETSCNDVCS